MNARHHPATIVRGLALAAIVLASGGVVAAVIPGEPGMSERSTGAWGQRLTRQAEAHRQERSDAAWSARLRLLAQERVNEAYADRLNGLADAQHLRGMSDRAAAAWTDRLKGLAER